MTLTKNYDFCLFATPLGECGIAWTCDANEHGEHAIARFLLPETQVGQTAQCLERHCAVWLEVDLPTSVQEVIDLVRKHLDGCAQDFTQVPLDFSGSGEFARQVYVAARQIPAGQVRTYGQLAREIGAPGAARAVGRALGANPIALIVPCHRIVAAGGKAGGFSAPGGLATKERLLQLEGAGLGLFAAAR